MLSPQRLRYAAHKLRSATRFENLQEAAEASEIAVELDKMAAEAEKPKPAPKKKAAVKK